MEKEKNNCCRVFHLYGKNMMQFYKLIYLPFLPTINNIIIIEDKSYVIKHIVIQYKEKGVGVDLYIEKNKNQDIEDLINKKNTLFPTHLGNQDNFQ